MQNFINYLSAAVHERVNRDET